MNPKMKITPAQRDELVKLYFEQGRHAAAELSVKYGVSPKYASSIAASMGMGRPRWRKGNRYKDNKVDPQSVRTHNDPRWARAKAVGMVVA